MSSAPGQSPLLVPLQPSPQVVAQMTEFSLLQCEGAGQLEGPSPGRSSNELKSDDSDAIVRMDITLDLSSDPNSHEMNARVATLFNQMYGPNPAVDASQVSLRHMSDALTNVVYIATIDPAPTVPSCRAPRALRDTAENQQQETVQMPCKSILSVYGKGSEELLSRDKELYWLSQLSLLGIGAQMFGIFGNGRVEEYLESTTLNSDIVRQSLASRDIARRVCELHTLVSYYRPYGSGNPSDKDAVYLNGKPELWNKVDTGLQMIHNKWQEIRRNCDSNPRCAEILDNWPKVVQAIDKFKLHVEQAHSPLVFAHNDLLSGNCLRLERTGKIEIVDYEYAGYNYRGYDIANHFCEWMNDYTQAEYLDIVNPARYPNEEERHNFLRAYIRAKAFIDANVKANAGAVKSDSTHLVKIRSIELSEDQLRKEVADLDREVALFVTASHLFWGTHGLVKASTIDNNLDYPGHAANRLSFFLSQVADMV
ncbi:hypothetical protein LPJ81_005548 [Coemansia sp. IMI 209127]|nr:hypothetical protein LPJ81_005548 [Coemansia sp. IMI 209127]